MSYQSEHDRSRLDSERRQASRDAEASSYSYAWRFGRYKGVPIVSIPDGYLRWMRNQSTNLEVVRRSSDELSRRNRLGIQVLR